MSNFTVYRLNCTAHKTLIKIFTTNRVKSKNNILNLNQVQSACYNYTSSAVTAQELSEIRIYPNPTNGLLTLDLGQISEGTVMLIDLQGRVIRSINVKSSISSIDLSDLPAAMYFLRISSQTETLILPLTKS